MLPAQSGSSYRAELQSRHADLSAAATATEHCNGAPQHCNGAPPCRERETEVVARPMYCGLLTAVLNRAAQSRSLSSPAARTPPTMPR